MDVKLVPFINSALKQVGAPYVWAAKGDYYVTREGRVVRQQESMLPLVFDCSGLVNWARMLAGGDDVRDTCNAQRLMDESLPVNQADPVLGRLRFYGTDAKHITHVSILLAREVGVQHALILDASGGDQTTRTVAEANARKACVRLHFDTRTDLIAERWPNFLKP